MNPRFECSTTTADFGRDFDATNLTRMMKFAEAFPDEAIVAALSQGLSWSHFRELLPLQQPLQREFYAEMCRMEGWSVRTLRGRIDSMLYERTALSKKPEELASKELAALKNSGEVGPSLVLKDPYILNFLDLQDHYMEKDFEDAILRELEMFLLELGAGFSFSARQKRFQLDGEDFYIDLLFYNRQLKRLVAVELSREAFGQSTKGRWSSTFVGWRSMRVKMRKVSRWASFFAPTRVADRSSSSSSTQREYTLRNI